MIIGVFDSGIGGQAVADSLQKEFTDATLVVVNDRAHVPYGSRPAVEIQSLTEAAIAPLLKAHCDVIVLACNTATAVAIDMLRAAHPEQHFIGLEPMIKPAYEQSQTRRVIVCATEATLRSERYELLKEKYANNLVVYEPDCSDWALRIEESSLEYSAITNSLQPYIEAGADVIVLACTHYHWIREHIVKLAGDTVIVIDPTQAIVQRIRSLTA